MNVLFLSQIVPYPPHGGVLQRGYNLLTQLTQHVRVHLLAFVHPDVLTTEAAREEARQHLAGICSSVEFFELWPKASPVHRAAALVASVWSTHPFSVIAHRSPAFRQRVNDFLAGTAIDLLHVDTIALSQFMPAACRCPSVLTHHNIESMLMERRGQVELRSLARRFLLREAAKLRAYECAVSPRFDVNVMMSTQDETALLSLVPGARTAVVPNGVDASYFRPDPIAETPTLIYTGGMNMFANRDAVLYFLREIWPIIVRERPDVRFFAVGQDPPRELRAMAEQDRRIHVTGFVDDIRPLVREAAVYVVPLRVGGGTRLKVLDAMASGKALVSTSIGCEGLEATPGRHLLVADEPRGFARMTLDLLGSPEQRRTLGDQARAFVVGQYSWQTVCNRLMDAYRLASTAKARVA